MAATLSPAASSTVTWSWGQLLEQGGGIVTTISIKKDKLKN